MNIYNLDRFVEAQDNGVYENALKEISNCKKRSHWIWFIFPQVYGLGKSDTAIKYSIYSKEEAIGYVNHEILGPRLYKSCEYLLNCKSYDIIDILGYVDSLKVRSSMTLFSFISNKNNIYDDVINKYYSNEYDKKTLSIIDSWEYM